MGRERKNQLGTSNLSARLDNSTIGSNSSTILTNDFGAPSPAPTGSYVKTLTRSLLAPDSFQAATKTEKSEKKKETATWKPAKIYERDFGTVHNESFTDPVNRRNPHLPTPKSTYEIAKEQIELREEKDAVDNLCKLIRTSYGTVASMLRSFNKKNTDNFTLYEFNEYIKRNKHEVYMPETEQKLVFDYIDPKHNGSIPVKDFLKTVEEHEFHDTEMNKDAQKIRDFLNFHIDQKKAQELERTKNNPTDPEFEELKKQKGIENEAEKIRKALAMNTYNIDVDHKQFNEVLDEVYFHKLPTNEMHRKYARFLHHSNLKLSQVPYYDIRSTELDRLKLKAAQIDQVLSSPEMGGKYLELTRSRSSMMQHRLNNSALLSSYSTQDLKDAVDVNNYDFDKYDDPHSEVASQEIKPPISSSQEPMFTKTNSQGNLNKSMGLSKSLPNLNLQSLSARPSPLAALGTGSASPAFSPMNNNNQQKNFRDLSGATKANKLEALPPKSKSKQRMPEPEEHSILHSSQKHDVYIKPVDGGKSVASGKHDDPSVANNSAAVNSTNTKSTSPSKKSKLLSELLEPQEGALKETDFYTHVIDESSSMGRLKDPSKVMRIEKIDPKVYATTGKKILSKGPTDWSRVGVGGGGGGSISEEDQFTTTNTHFYPPLHYEPSQPVTRDLISDASLIFRQKEYVRQQRYQRTQANLEITRQRIEFDQLEKQMRSLRREASRLEDSIRYKTSVMLNDLYAFKQQPLQRMAKRQNIHLSDRMWNGSHDKQTVVLVEENRDFRSTYGEAFNSAAKAGGEGGLDTSSVVHDH